MARAASPAFDAFAEHVAEEWLRGDPQYATELQYFPRAEQDKLDRQWLPTDPITQLPIDPAARARRVAQAQDILKRLAAYDRATLTSMQRASASVIDSALRKIVELGPVAENWYIFQPESGQQLNLLGCLGRSFPMRDRRDAENYLERLRQLGPVLGMCEAEARAREAKGLVPPTLVLEITIAMLDAHLTTPAHDHFLVKNFRERLAKLSDVPEHDRAEMETEVESLVRKSVIPALGRIRIFLFNEKAIAGAQLGFSHLPDGREAYAAAIHASTDFETEPSLMALYDWKQVSDANVSEIDRLLLEARVKGDTPTQRLEEYDRSLRVPKGKDAEERLLQEGRRFMAESEPRVREAFGVFPRARWEIRPNGPYGSIYDLAAPESGQPGIFLMPTDPDDVDAGLMLHSICHHEVMPGHHFQMTLQQEQPDLPRFRRYRVFGDEPAFLEGWALYAERVSLELGWYDHDLPGKIGALEREVYCARRAVADCLLHSGNKTPEDMERFGFDLYRAARLAVWPGQARAYWFGERHILSMREILKKGLGERFSLQEFHQVILRTGNVPLDELDATLVEWAQAIRKRK